MPNQDVQSLIDAPLTPQEQAEAVSALEMRLFRLAQMRLQQNPVRFSKESDLTTPDIRDALTSLETSLLLTHTTQEHALSTNQRYILGQLVWDVAKKEIVFTRFAEKLSELLLISKETAASIAYWIGKNTFEPFKEYFGEKYAMDMQNWQTYAKPISEKASQMQPIYPQVPISKTAEKPELLGGLDIPVPPAPRTQNQDSRFKIQEVSERDIPWQPKPKYETYNLKAENLRSVARPGDVAKLLEKNLIKTGDDSENGNNPGVQGNIVDLSQ